MPAPLRSRAFVLTLLLSPSGCTLHSTGEPNGACTAIGCHDGLVVSVTPTSSWPHGEYRFTIEADGKTTTCTGRLPLPDCDTRALTCDDDDVSIGESGCALPATDHAFSDIVLPSGPASVTVTIELDGQALATQAWTPAYQTVQPNGPGCPPTCTNAAVGLDLQFD